MLPICGTGGTSFERLDDDEKSEPPNKALVLGADATRLKKRTADEDDFSFEPFACDVDPKLAVE